MSYKREKVWSSTMGAPLITDFHPMSLSPWGMLNAIPSKQDLLSQEFFCPPQGTSGNI